MANIAVTQNDSIVDQLESRQWTSKLRGRHALDGGLGSREVVARVRARSSPTYAAANGLATVVRAWIDRDAIAEALGLTHDRQVLFSQTIGYPKR